MLLICLIAPFIIDATVQAFAVDPVQDAQYLHVKEDGLKAFAEGNYVEAERCFSKTVEIARVTRAGSRDLALDLNSLAEVYRIRRRTAQAQQLFEEALSILKNIPGSERQTASVLQNLATVQYSDGRYSEAERTLQKALTNAEKSVGRNGLAYASSWTSWAKSMQATRKLVKPNG
jgi:tetratricopeptide (TPR) repeat protein